MVKKKKKIWIPIVALLLVGASVAGFFLIPREPQEEVFVFSYDMVGYVNYYQNGTESYGMVTTDRVQSAYLSETQKVTDIVVYQGQEVKKGDVLYRYNTTLSDLELERKDLEIQQMEMNLKTAQADLRALKKMKPMVLPDEPDEKEEEKEEENTTVPADAVEGKIYNEDTGEGTFVKPYYVWLKSSTGITEEMIYDYLQAKNADVASGDYVYVVFRIARSAGSSFTKEYSVRYVVKNKVAEQGGIVASQPAGRTVQINETQDDTTPTESTEATEPSEETQATEPTTQPPQTTIPAPVLDKVVTVTANAITLAEPENIPQGCTVRYYISANGTKWSYDSTDRAFTDLAEGTVYYFKASFVDESGKESESSNVLLVSTSKMERVIEMRFYDPASRSEDDNDDEEIIWNSGYTSSELASMRKEKNEQIDQLKFDIKMAKAELKIMKKEADTGEVTAEFDGVVASVLEPANAVAMNAPMIKVVGGGGFYVEGSVSELDLASIQVGQTVTVTSWDTNMTYEGTIIEVSTYPAEDENSFYYGNSNVSYYPYKVFIDETAELQEGFYVSMTYQTQPQEEGVMYLENAFLREENGEHYVYVRNEDGLLEKRIVQVGDSSDGYMTRILSGLEQTDYIAFPYGKTVVEGAPTVEGTWEDLYGY